MILHERLGVMFDWYKRMISETTGRLVYTYDPETDVAVADGSPIRNIASVWDVELLSNYLGRTELMPLVERSLRKTTEDLVAIDGALMLDSARLGEPSGIAHSAFMILSLLDSALPDRLTIAVRLAEGIRRQQRADGSFKIYFGRTSDDGLEFYPGEAMLALMHTYATSRDTSLLRSVESGFRYYATRFPPDAVADLLVFYANWQSQYAAPLAASTRDDALREQARAYISALHDRVLDSAFYDDVERHPHRQATVEVACALEGVNEAYSMARDCDEQRANRYARGVRVAVEFLLRAQRVDHCTPRERGGFGHSLTRREQRIDVTGHVLNGFIKTVANGLYE